MATGFIDRLARWCGGSRTVAWLAVVNCAVTVVLMLVQGIGLLAGHSGEWTETLLVLPAPPSLAVRHPWTVLTYMVTQYSPLHMIFNMLWLVWFGGVLYPYVSERRMLWLYLAGGLAGAVCFEAASAVSGKAGALCGSSAAVLGVMTAAAVRLPDRELRLWLIGAVKLKWIALVMVLLTFAGGGGGAASGGIYAHAGGVIAGACFGFWLRRRAGEPLVRVRLRPRRRPTPEGAREVAQAMGGRLGDKERLDALLDKIRVSGYNSLSSAERRELDAISRRLRK